MTGQVSFDSHARNVLAASVEYVNRLTPGYSGGTPYPAPADEAQAVSDALAAIGSAAVRRAGRRAAVGRARGADADRLRSRACGDLDRAADEVNALLVDTNSRPQLDRRQRRLEPALPRPGRRTRQRLGRRLRGRPRARPGHRARRPPRRLRGPAVRPRLRRRLPQRPAPLLLTSMSEPGQSRRPPSPANQLTVRVGLAGPRCLRQLVHGLAGEAGRRTAARPGCTGEIAVLGGLGRVHPLLVPGDAAAEHFLEADVHVDAEIPVVVELGPLEERAVSQQHGIIRCARDGDAADPPPAPTPPTAPTSRPVDPQRLLPQGGRYNGRAPHRWGRSRRTVSRPG